LLLKASWVWISCTCELWNLIGVLRTIGCKVVMSFYFKSCFNLSSTKGQYLNSCPTYWFKWICYHLNNKIILTWNSGIIRTCGHSICPKIGVASQTCWLGGCPCHTVMVLLMLPLVLHDAKKLNDKKVFILICTIVPIGSLIGYIPTMNLLL
jgi:hypothetical protein